MQIAAEKASENHLKSRGMAKAENREEQHQNTEIHHYPAPASIFPFQNVITLRY